MEALTPVMMVDMVSTVVMPARTGGRRHTPGEKHTKNTRWVTFSFKCTPPIKKTVLANSKNQSSNFFCNIILINNIYIFVNSSIFPILPLKRTVCVFYDLLRTN